MRIVMLTVLGVFTMCCAAAQSTLEVGETTLPPQFVESAKKFIGSVIPDPRGGQVMKFVTKQIRAWDEIPQETNHVGWVMPPNETGVQYGITISGLVFPVIRVGEPASAKELIADRSEQPNFERGSTMTVLRAIELLVCAGYLREAEELFGQAGGSLSNYNSTFIVYSFLNAHVENVGHFAAFGDWPNALKIAKLAQNAQSVADRPFPFFGDSLTVDMIVYDLERRISENQKTISIRDIADFDKEQEREKLIASFRGQIINDSDQPSLRVEELFRPHGESLIPALIEEYRTNNWLHYTSNGVPRRQRSNILQQIYAVWDGIPRLESQDGKPNFPAAANYLLKEWNAQKDLSIAQRHLRTIANQNLDDREVSESISLLISMGTGGGNRTRYRPGNPPMQFERLSKTEQEQLAQILERRIDEFGKTASQRAEFSLLTSMAVGLAHLRGKAAIPRLRNISSEFIAIAQKVNNFDDNGFDGAVGTIICQRIALGDSSSAVLDFKEVMKHYAPPTFGTAACLRMGWEFPENKKIQQLVEDQLSIMLRQYLATNLGAGRTYTLDHLLRSDTELLLKSPGAKRVLSKFILDETVIGKIKIASNSSQQQFEYRPDGRQGHLNSWPLLASDLVPQGSEADLELGDAVLESISMRLNNFTPRIYFSLEMRRAERKRMSGFLLNPDFNWSKYFASDPQNLDLPIYRP